jgi:flagellar assembly protein FliH
MAAIIPAAPVSGTSRQLRRPGVAAVVAAPLAPAAPVAPAVAVEPVAPVAAQLSDVQREAVVLQAQAERLRERQDELAAATAALTQRQAELELREQQVQAAQRQLNEEVAAIKEDAERRGLALGRQQGEQDAQEAVRGQVERLNGVVQALQQSKRSVLEENQDMLAEIAFAAVCRVLGAHAASRDGVRAMIDSLVDHEQAQHKMTVRLHPHDLALLSASADRIDPRLSFQADAGIELGGCIIDSPRGTLDARLELQLAHLRDALVAVRKQHSKFEAPI